MMIPTEIEQCIEAEDWAGAKVWIGRGLKEQPEDHWYMTRMSTVLYEMRDYKGALAWAEKALKLAPQCPLARWDYANALSVTGSEAKAIEVWKGLVRNGVERIAFDGCGEGIRWAKSLINDCRYRIALAYGQIGKAGLARRYLKSHIESRRPGIPSLYPLKDVKAKLQSLS